jgi:hypothetical protein
MQTITWDQLVLALQTLYGDEITIYMDGDCLRIIRPGDEDEWPDGRLVVSKDTG